MKISENYVFAILSPIEAREFNEKTKTDLYKMFSDGTESFIESRKDLEDAIDLGIEIGIEIGELDDLKAEFDQNAPHSTNFDEWLLEKTEFSKEI
jgi:hypothetical protein